MDEDLVILRPYERDIDAPFVFASWRNGLYYSPASGVQEVDSDSFFRKQSHRIKRILDESTVRIACMQKNQTQIIGYSVIRDSHLEWVYVKADYRRKGIANLLARDRFITVTDQLTKVGLHLVHKMHLKTEGETNGKANSPDTNTD